MASFGGIKIKQLDLISNKNQLEILDKPAFFSDISSTIKIIGVGGGANNIIKNCAMSIGLKQSESVTFTDTHLNASFKMLKDFGTIIHLQESDNTFFGGGSVEQGMLKAEKSIHKFAEKNRLDYAIVVSCLGGATGSGAGPVIAEHYKRNGTFVIGVITKSAPFEGLERSINSSNAVKEFVLSTDFLIELDNKNITIPNNICINKYFSSIDYVVSKLLQNIISVLQAVTGSQLKLKLEEFYKNIKYNDLVEKQML